jgi:chromosome segregation ATPase
VNETAPKTKPNRLTAPQQYRLTKWVDDNKWELQGMSDPDIAERWNTVAEESSDITVTSTNVSTARRTLGITLESGGPSGADLDDIKARLSALEEVARAISAWPKDTTDRLTGVEDKITLLQSRVTDMDRSGDAVGEYSEEIEKKLTRLSERLDLFNGSQESVRVKIIEQARDVNTVIRGFEEKLEATESTVKAIYEKVEGLRRPNGRPPKPKT